jgi:hypothetical protein
VLARATFRSRLCCKEASVVLYPPKKRIIVELEQEVFEAMTDAYRHKDEEIAERLFNIWVMLPTKRPWPIGPLTTEF